MEVTIEFEVPYVNAEGHDDSFTTELSIDASDSIDAVLDRLGDQFEDATGLDASEYISVKNIDTLINTWNSDEVEEWFMNDCDGIDELLDTLRVLDKMPDRLMAPYQAYCENLGQAVEFSEFEEAYQGEHDSEKAFAEQLIEDIEGLTNMSDLLRNNIDWEGVWYDLEQGGDYFSIQAVGHSFYIFRNM